MASQLQGDWLILMADSLFSEEEEGVFKVCPGSSKLQMKKGGGSLCKKTRLGNLQEFAMGSSDKMTFGLLLRNGHFDRGNCW